MKNRSIITSFCILSLIVILGTRIYSVHQQRLQVDKDPMLLLKFVSQTMDNGHRITIEFTSRSTDPKNPEQRPSVIVGANGWPTIEAGGPFGLPFSDYNFLRECHDMASTVESYRKLKALHYIKPVAFETWNGKKYKVVEFSYQFTQKGYMFVNQTAKRTASTKSIVESCYIGDDYLIHRVVLQWPNGRNEDHMVTKLTVN